MTDIAHVIQLAVAPVFLLSGIGAILAVMTGRLSRIIDRGRVLNGLKDLSADQAANVAAEHEVLLKRGRVVNVAIGLCTATALLIAAVIIMLFLSFFLNFDAAIVVAALFVAGMLSFSAALVCFLREITLATHALRFGRM